MYETINASEAEREGLKKVTEYHTKFVKNAGPAQETRCKQFTPDPVSLFIAAAILSWFFFFIFTYVFVLII